MDMIYVFNLALRRWWGRASIVTLGSGWSISLTYLRTLENGRPAVGKFEGWPDKLEDFKLLGPHCARVTFWWPHS